MKPSVSFKSRTSHITRYTTRHGETYYEVLTNVICKHVVYLFFNRYNSLSALYMCLNETNYVSCYRFSGVGRLLYKK